MSCRKMGRRIDDGRMGGVYDIVMTLAVRYRIPF